MREILFRGKRTDNGEWVYGDLIRDCICNTTVQYIGYYLYGEVADTENDDVVSVIPETVGQYTGLKDKNGKKIFEGDILDYFDTLYIVSWSDNLLTYIVTSADEKKEYLFYLNKANMDCVYIVGNIHDNPELLEVD